MESNDAKSEAQPKRSKLTRNTRAVLVSLVVGAVIVAVAAGGRWYGTPEHVRARGVFWEVRVEDPVSLDAVEGIMAVFSGTVWDVLRVPTVGYELTRLTSDGIENYTVFPSWQSGGWQGPVHVPVYFLTGNAHARGHLSPYTVNSWGDGLRLGIAFIAYIKACCSADQIERLLHEFGHNLGLKDLYGGNDEGIQGCEDIPVIMSKGASPSPSFEPPSGEMLFRYEELNVSSRPHQLQIFETYYDRPASRLIRSSHIIAFNESSTFTWGWLNASYDLTSWRSSWTQEQIRYLGLPWTSEYSCPQEGLP